VGGWGGGNEGGGGGETGRGGENEFKGCRGVRGEGRGERG